MEKLLYSQNRHWQNRYLEKPYKGLYNRDILQTIINRLELKQIEAIQGIRRSGKSTLFKLIINHLSKSCDPKEILYINFDDPFFIPFYKEPTKLYSVIETAQKITGKRVKYLFLDEVQSIIGWERFVKSVYDQELFKKIFITGSNATFLNSKLAKLLSGRYLSSIVYPLSFAEILKIKGFNGYLDMLERSYEVLQIVDNMLKFGSFVEVFESKDEFKRDLIKSYYDTIILKDCVANNSIRDVKSFQELSYYAISNIGSLYSYNSLSKAINISDISVKEYINILEDSYLLKELKHYSYSLKEQNSSKKKLYLIDNGFMMLNFNFSQNLGLKLENLVFTELLKSGFELYFFNKNYECDFIAKKDNKLIAIQVSYEINEKNIKRELNGLKKLPINCDEKYIITYNESKEIDNIKIVPFWEFFRKKD